MSSLWKKGYAGKGGICNYCYVNPMGKKSLVCRAALITMEVVFCVVLLCSISAGNTCGS